MTSNNIQGLEALEAWKRAKDFTVKVCKQVLLLLPVEEKWSLSQQIRRAAQSVPTNIGEGHGRIYFQETIRFCYIDLRKETEELIRIINGYIAYLKRAKIGANEPGAGYTVREESALYSAYYPEDAESSGNL